ncbi:MAG: porin [Verrucomicrobia bacterium]|nr:porin [Verrucomicrobiota bacterium]
MKTLSYTLCAVLAAGFAFTGDAQVKPKSKKVTELKFSGRIQGQWDGIESDAKDGSKENRNHFYFRRLFLGGHAKAGDNWGGDIVMDFAASPNSEGDGKGDQVFIDGASVWYKHSDAFRADLGQLKVPFGLEETTSSSKTKAIERSVVNRQFAEQLKFNARHTGLFAKGSFDGGFSYAAAVVNSGQNHNSKDSKLKGGEYGYDSNELSYFGQLAYANYDGDITHKFGVAAGIMELDEAGNDYNADDITAYNIFGQLGFGRFILEGEYMTGKVSGPGHDHKGYSIQGSYAISNAPAGSWELVYRYSTVENAQGLVSAKEIVRRANIAESEVDEIDQHYIGVNYLFNGHDAKLMLGYEMNDLMDSDGDSTWNGNSSSADGFRARVQFLF